MFALSESFTFPTPCSKQDHPACQEHCLLRAHTYSVCVLSFNISSILVEGSIKTQSFGAPFQSSSTHLSQSSRYPQVDFLNALLKRIPPWPRPNFCLFIAVDGRGTESIWWTNYNQCKRRFCLTKWIPNGQVDWMDHFWSKRIFSILTILLIPILYIIQIRVKKLQKVVSGHIWLTSKGPFCFCNFSMHIVSKIHTYIFRFHVRGHHSQSWTLK